MALAYRNRTDELEDLITLYRVYSEPTKCEVLIELNKSFPQDILKVKDFFRSKIESFAKQMIESFLGSKQMDYIFVNRLYEFDKTLFEETFQNAIKKFYNSDRLSDLLKAIRCVDKFAQAIPGYEALFSKICDSADQNKINQLLELSGDIVRMRLFPAFINVAPHDKARVWRIAKNLPLHYGDLYDTSGVVITNLGNGCNINLDTDHTANYFTFAFGAHDRGWKVIHNTNENFFKFITDDGLVLCLETPETDSDQLKVKFVSREHAYCSKWNIQFYNQADLSIGCTIKAAGQDAYLCASPYVNFKYFVQVEKSIDLEDSARFTWKFRSAWKFVEEEEV